MSEALLKYAELFTRNCTFVSNLNDPVNINDFINSPHFEWKLSLANYKDYMRFYMEIIDVPNGVLGLPFKTHWNVFTINIDANSFSSELQDIKRDILLHLKKFVD